MYKQAAHCYEELLLLGPTNLTYHLRYADTLYTIGGNQETALAQTYYAHVLEMSQGANVRALYGICLCTSHPKSRKVTIHNMFLKDIVFKSEEGSIGSLSAKALVKMYTDLPWLPFVKSTLRRQGFAFDRSS